jgi:hypothetical protein
MSAFSGDGGSGGGISAEDYDNLTQDAELQAVRTELLTELGGLIMQRSQECINATYSVNTSMQTLLYTQANVPAGQMEMRFATDGQASPGWTKLGGIAVPTSFFDLARSVALPYSIGSSGTSSNAIAQASRVSIGDAVYFSSSSGKLRVLNLGTLGWQDEANIPAFNLYPTTFGSVAGKFAAFGLTFGSSSSPAVYLFDPVSRTWSAAASQPSFLQSSGVADLGDGRMATFGGKNIHANQTTSATNIVDTVRIYTEATDSWDALAQVLPVRMHNVRSVPLPNGSVVLFPQQVSDGTTLSGITTSRRLFSWTEAGGAVALDDLPAEVNTQPWLMVARADNKVIYVPTVAPSSGTRARLLNPSAPSGSQWSEIDWDYNDGATYGAVPLNCPLTQTASGFALTSQTVATGISGLFATFVEAPAEGYSQVIYQYKTA